jgi:hypothetical protein
MSGQGMALTFFHRSELDLARDLLHVVHVEANLFNRLGCSLVIELKVSRGLGSGFRDPTPTDILECIRDRDSGDDRVQREDGHDGDKGKHAPSKSGDVKFPSEQQFGIAVAV